MKALIRRIRKGFIALPSMGRILAKSTPSFVEDIVDFVLENPFIHPAQVRSEFIQLAGMICNLKPKAALEIGTYGGGTLFAICKLSDPEATIISLDLPNGKWGGGYNSLQRFMFKRFAFGNQKLHFIRDDSHKPESRVKVEANLQGRFLDFLFIDGDHSYHGVKQDFEMYSPLVRSGGLIAFHDIAEHQRIGYQDCEVSRFWEEIKSRLPHKEFIEDRAQGWAGIGVLQV
ncbi:MAG TPA: class I SAM-dependent methyltransferase [Candidatus Angelobacter sp.]|jgi:predicted O-methyltransferase YrrM